MSSENDLEVPVRYGKQHYESDFNFRDLNDPLIKYIDDYYKSPYSPESAEQYNNEILKRIKSNNIKELECLWSGIYFHDRDHPLFTEHLVYAARFSNFETFEHCLYGYENYSTFDALESLAKDYLLQIANTNTENPKIAELIKTFTPYIVSGIYNEWPLN